MDYPTLLAFLVSYFLIALSPGFCMTLSMTLGISIGVRRTLWMMIGELSGVFLVAAASFAGVTALMLKTPQIFTIARFAAAAFLIWSGIKAWRASSDISGSNPHMTLTRQQLVAQGFVTATSNPKGWIFLAALLPVFIDPARPVFTQALLMLPIMIVIEFISLLIYASGGKMLKELLTRRGLGHWLHQISACLMFGIAIWLVLS